MTDSELREFLTHAPKMCSYIDWATRASIPLTVEDNLISRCRAIIDLKLYEKMHAVEALTTLPAYLMVDGFLNDMLTGWSSDFGYYHMSSHQELLGPLINVLLDETMFGRCEPGSSLFVEVYRREQRV